MLLVLLALGRVPAWHRGDRRQAVLLATWVALPPLVLCGLQLLGWGPGLVARYWTFCLPAIAIGAAVARRGLWSRSRRRRSPRPCWCSSSPCRATWRSGRSTDTSDRAGGISRGPRHPTLQDAPLLVEGWDYRALLSNEPALHDRMVLIVDPARRGGSTPGRTVRTRPRSPAGRRGGPVVVLQGEPGVSARLPARRAFAVSGPSSTRSRSSRCGASTSANRSACSPRPTPRSPPTRPTSSPGTSVACPSPNASRLCRRLSRRASTGARRTTIAVEFLTTGPNRGARRPPCRMSCRGWSTGWTTSSTGFREPMTTMPVDRVLERLRGAFQVNVTSWSSMEDPVMTGMILNPDGSHGHPRRHHGGVPSWTAP